MNKHLPNSSWGKIKSYINTKDVDYVFSRKELLTNIPKIPPATVDTYRQYLEAVFILQTVGRGKYKLIQKIPQEMNTTVLFDLLEMQRGKEWQRWFMPIEDRMKRLYK